jgi:2-oxoacid:acceptor oxidoreductase delta subunit (pyruvate/2-ketoisovalerate family)
VAALRAWEQLPPGGAVAPGGAPRPHTGSWRTGSKPSVDLSRCVNCLICWLHCPDAAIRLDGTTFDGFDYDFCKGCEICAQICPTQAIVMVPEETALPAGGAHDGD